MEIGRVLVVVGIILIVSGLLISGNFTPLGRLPGDILIERERFTMYIPITTMLIISFIVMVILWIVSSKW